MEDKQSKGQRLDQIDVPILWVLVRGAQILLTVIYAKIAYLSSRTDSFGLDLISSVVFLLIVGAFLHRFVTGTADSSGIHYRRYFRLNNVAWADVVEIQWVGFRLKVLVKGRGKRKRTIIFLLNPLKSTGAYWAHRLGAESAPPDILERIHALQIETPPPIASAPLYPKWIVSTFIGLVVLMMLVMVWKLIFALSPH